MTTKGIEGVHVQTHNWGKTARFFQALGYEPEFTTDHNSGLFRNGDGPYVFIEEIPNNQTPRTQLILTVADADAFQPNSDLDVVTPFEATHYGTKEMTVRDPDGRTWSLQSQG
ncbi:VOC family protein [Nocardia barduliensis]|uniref:VOC family protein n=1 Tax=Nocardia barduliensis TaxID=2736643 RepID=UPI001574E33D|nr:VOC family protein [Nocardia barduliensis]